MTFPLPSGGPKVPQKVSLVSQTTEVLKDSIDNGIWVGQLPGENELCKLFHVSRVTLRSALNHLQREGWVLSTRGKHRKIIPHPRRLPAASNRVILLSESPLQVLQPSAIYWIDCLRQFLGESGFHLEIHTSRAAFGSSAERSLLQMQRHFCPAGWILYHSSQRMQQWFSAQALPCIIAGSYHPNVRLPSVDLDYQSVCRHAVGRFLARKHQHLALLNPDSGTAGDLKSEQGFLDAAKAEPGRKVQAVVVRHNGTVQGICNKLDLLLTRPHPPTALLVSRSAFTLTTLSHLLRRKLNLPRDMAVISRDDDSYLENFVPTIARYSASPAAYARKISSLVLQTVNGVVQAGGNTLLIPSFVPGQTLG